MTTQTRELWRSMDAAGLAVAGQAPETDPASPWYVKVLLGFSGWLAALFLFGFFAMWVQDLLDSAPGTFALGSVMVGAAYGLLKAQRNDFLDHLGLACSMAGQVLVAASIFIAIDDVDGVALLLLMVLQIVLLFIMPNYIHKVLSGLFAAVAMTLALAAWEEPYAAAPILMIVAACAWLFEYRSVRWMQTLQAAGTGVVVTLVGLKGTLMLSGASGLWFRQRDMDIWLPAWASEILLGLVALTVAWWLLVQMAASLRVRLVVMAAMLLLCGVSLQASGIIIGVTILLMGFYGANMVLLGLGAASLVFYISTYYYLLETTLLQKSATLFALGLVLLLARWVLRRIGGEGGQGDAA